MSDQTKIEWTNTTWNPIVGCTKVSAGCDHCYAIQHSNRLKGNPNAKVAAAYEDLTKIQNGRPNWTGKVRLIPERLEIPTRWRKPRRIFVNSMSDLFHEDVQDEWIDEIFAVMALCPEHTFQCLTKRPERMWKWFAGPCGLETREQTIARAAQYIRNVVYDARGPNRHLYPPACADISNRRPWWPGWPLPNVWLGVSAEDQKAADLRIPILLQTPAAVRYVSLEPLLSPIDIGMSTAICDCCRRWPSRWIRLQRGVASEIPFDPGIVAHPGIYRATSNMHGALSVQTSNGLLGVKPAEFDVLPKLDWVIAGGESGPGARPVHLNWLRSIRDQCQVAEVPCFFKQWGAYQDGSAPGELCREVIVCGCGEVLGTAAEDCANHANGCDKLGEARVMARVGKKKAGREIDGREWNEFPDTKGPKYATRQG